MGCMKAQISNRSETRTSEQIELGISDERGRAVGFRVARWEATVTEAADPGSGWELTTLPVGLGGTMFCGRVTPTRDGNAFGASQPEIRVATAAELEMEIARKLAGGKRRYAKKYATVRHNG
jgi:hypothetical protein